MKVREGEFRKEAGVDGSLPCQVGPFARSTFPVCLISKHLPFGSSLKDASRRKPVFPQAAGSCFCPVFRDSSSPLLGGRTGSYSRGIRTAAQQIHTAWLSLCHLSTQARGAPAARVLPLHSVSLSLASSPPSSLLPAHSSPPSPPSFLSLFSLPSRPLPLRAFPLPPSRPGPAAAVPPRPTEGAAAPPLASSCGARFL